MTRHRQEHKKTYNIELTGQSMSEMGADRTWQFVVEADSEEEALQKVRSRSRGWYIYGTHLRVLKPGDWVSSTAEHLK